MNELEDHLLSVLLFPLRDHVTDAMHSDEMEVVGVGLSVAGDLAICCPWLPLGSDGPLKRLDPAAGTNGRHDSIGVS